MKRKIFSILFALVLVCSFSLVTAVPTGAQEPTFVLNGNTFNSDYGPDRGYVAYIQPYDAENQFHSLPDQAIEQYGNPGDAPLGPWREGAWFNFEYDKPFGGGETKAWGGQNYVVTYWWNPCVGEYLPINGDGDDIYIYQPDEGKRPMGILYQGEWRMFDAGTNGLSDVNGDDFWWDLSDAGVAEGDTIEALAWWCNALGFPGLLIEKEFPDGHKEQYAGPDALDMDGDGSTEPLTFIGGGTPMSWHDPFYMGIKYATVVLPPPEVWVDDKYFFGGDNDGHTWCYDAFASVQDGIDAVAGSIVNVAPGTYNEDVTIGKDLTLKGAQAGVDARGRTGAESEIVGVVVVTSAATDVVFDGFKFTSPTRAVNPRGFNLGIESASSTIRNNILVAEENEGHGAYGNYLTFLDITNALVEQNSFSGHLDLVQIPNVILFSGIAAGTVTVQNNEMHDVGGGGGIGIMCTNELAIINITGNDIDHTGDGIWVYQNPSAFDTLSITNNNIYHNNACHGDLCQNIDTGIKLVGTINGTVVVSGNDFLDNQIQVDNTAGVVDLEEVLDTNTFDRAVVVDHPGASLLHTIWSFIQDGVDAAVAGDTVDVLAGTYNEGVVDIAKSLTLEGANAGVCAGVDPGTREAESIVNAFHVSVNDVVVDGFQIEGAAVAGSGDATNAIVLDGGTSGHTISNNILPGPGGTPPAGTDRGIAFGYDVSSTTVSCNEIYGWMSGIYINPTALGSNLLFQYNSIHDNWAGIGSDGLNDVSILYNDFTNNVEGFGSSNVGVNVVVHFNNFCGNTTAIAQYGGEPIDATNNWWCHVSGPKHNPGYGDPVSGNVLFNPWLLAPFIPGEEPTTFDKTLALNIGWTLVSTDNRISAASVVGEGVILAINYTPSDGWFEVDPTALVPVDAIYLKMVEGGGLGFDYSGGVPVASSKNLDAGWNLISSATLTNAKAVLSPLRFIDVGEEQGIGLATLVSQGNYNQHSPSFYLATLTDFDWGPQGIRNIILNPFDGYWVYMNAGKPFGVVPGAQSPVPPPPAP